ncbi:MAG TPA: glycosyltransferase family 2 protein [Acidimicrobiales bacterium]|nr:glycosyltransferase family 2 protein [Acidimicrobiales bacterium]
MAVGPSGRELSYVLPLRRWQIAQDDELADYLGWLAGRVEVIVVDGSADEVFAGHRRQFGHLVRHIPVDPGFTGRYGKVNGVNTGIRAAGNERVVVADDDVRYDAAGLERMAGLLDHADVVRPQNYFEPLPWHARWDTARTLLNRAFAADYPGTLGLRRSRLLAAGGYDGDCLFENLELMRTVEVAGGRVVAPLDFYVRRLPPSSRHFWSQRVRQAYDDFALPGRLAAELAVLPGVGGMLLRRRPAALVGLAAAAVGAAEVGRRRAGGTRIYPPSCSLFAPLWLAERGVCAWMAVWLRLARGGVPYAGATLSKAANSKRVLRRRMAAATAAGARPTHGSGGGGR